MVKLIAFVFFAVFTVALVQSQEPNCPPDTSQPTFFPDPTACNRYYMCTDAGPILMTCPPPLLWNQAMLSCVHPGSISCTPTTTTTRATTTTTQRTTTTTNPLPDSTTEEDYLTTSI